MLNSVDCCAVDAYVSIGRTVKSASLFLELITKQINKKEES